MPTLYPASIAAARQRCRFAIIRTRKPALAKSLQVACAVICAAGLNGCGTVGPRTIRANRAAYNQAVQQTNDEELLLNLVRSRYRDTLYFTSVERIAATQELLKSVGGSAGVTDARTSYAVPPTGSSVVQVLTRPFTLGPASVSVNERPTIFYAPVEGEKFVRQMMTPMNPELLLLLVKSGWSLDRVFALGVAELNGLKNAPTASGPTPSREPEFRAFREAIRLLRVLQREQLIDLTKPANGEGIELRLAAAAAGRPETQRLKELLRLKTDRDRFKVIASSDSESGDVLAISTRPVISALNYLSQGVDVPEEHIRSGKVRRTTRADGSGFDWQELLGDVFRVQVSLKAPPADNVSTAVHYRSAWFYIADDDLDAKSTFVLLTQLIALHSAPATSGPAMSFSFGK
jgi:hypothetical protein